VREGDIVIMIGNVGRMWKWRSESAGYLLWIRVPGKRKEVKERGEWYNHHDSVKRLGKDRKGKKKWGRWIEGETRKWKGYQYHP
jgi:hypothetical protein